MATHLQVVLKQDIDNLGHSGDIVRVRPGYARNFLLPRGLASVATRGNVEAVEHERRVALAHAAKEQQAARGEASKIEGVVVKISKQVGEEGKLFGSVTTQEIAEALAAQGFKIDRKKIVVPAEVARQLGTFDASIKLAKDVVASFKVEVVAAS